MSVKSFKVGKVKIGKMNRDVWVTFELTDGNLSISGVEGPRPNGNCYGSCGQIDITELAPEIAEIWKRWHLNNLRAGTPAQMSFLRGLDQWPDYNTSKYLLSEVGLEPDHGYSYGSKWLKEELSADIVELFDSLVNDPSYPWSNV